MEEFFSYFCNYIGALGTLQTTDSNHFEAKCMKMSRFYLSVFIWEEGTFNWWDILVIVLDLVMKTRFWFSRAQTPGVRASVLIDFLINWLIDWLMEWLIDWLISAAGSGAPAFPASNPAPFATPATGKNTQNINSGCILVISIINRLWVFKN